MASGSFYDYSSSNSCTYLSLKTEYSTTAYEGYTRVTATSYIVVESGGWDFTTYKSSTTPSISIDGDTTNLVQYQVWVGKEDKKYKVATNTVDIRHTTTKKITISSSINLSGVTIKSTGGKVGKYSASKEITLEPKATACTAPTTFTVSSDDFETEVTLKWSGASGGINNAISGYLIRYKTSADKSTWGDWKDLVSISSTASSGSKTSNVSSVVSRGHYVQFAIKTLTSDSDYNSSWVFSNVIRRKPYTKCTAPTTFTVSPNNFDSTIKLSWSGAKGGTSNGIKSYYIQYATSATAITWGSWNTLQTVSTNKTSYELEINISSKIGRGVYVKFRIRTQGDAGSSYYSDYKSSSSVRRNPYSRCTAPTKITLSSEQTLDKKSYNDIFENNITFTFSGAKSGEGHSIKGYYIEYRTSNDKSTWGNWIEYSTQTTSKTSYTFTAQAIADKVNRGQYVQFRVKTIGTVSGYDSDYKETSVMRKNSKPSNVTQVGVLKSLEYSYGDNITIRFPKPYDADDNVYKYLIRLYPNVNNTSVYYDYEKISDETFTEFTLASSDTHYKQIANNQQLKFAVKAVDNFGIQSTSYTSSNIITRYDITGINIEMNGKWRSCQLFYLPISTTKVTAERLFQDSSWFNNWDYGDLNSETGEEIQPISDDDYCHMRTGYMSPLGITIYQNDFYEYDIECTFFYYDASLNFVTKSDTQILNKYDENLSKPSVYTIPDESYPYMKIVLYSSPENIYEDGANLRDPVIIEQTTSATGEWIEYEAQVAIDGVWAELYDGT